MPPPVGEFPVFVMILVLKFFLASKIPKQLNEVGKCQIFRTRPGMQYKCLLQFFGLFLSYLLMHMYNNLLLMLYVRSMLLYKYTYQSNDIHILIFTQSLFMHLFLSVHESYFFYEKKKVQLNCQLLDCQFMGRKDSYCELSTV